MEVGLPSKRGSSVRLVVAGQFQYLAGQYVNLAVRNGSDCLRYIALIAAFLAERRLPEVGEVSVPREEQCIGVDGSGVVDMRAASISYVRLHGSSSLTPRNHPNGPSRPDTGRWEDEPVVVEDTTRPRYTPSVHAPPMRA